MQNQIVLVTGASSGIGKMTALRLKKRGYLVYGVARRLENMKELVTLGIEIREIDITEERACQQLMKEIIAKHGRIDILINSAGYGSYGAMEDVPLEEARYQFEVNVFGLALLTKLVLPYMRKQGAGKIINISSIGGKAVLPFGSWYHASKFAVEGLSDVLRLEVKPFGIDTIIIEPGAIQTEWEAIALAHLHKASHQSAYLPFMKGTSGKGAGSSPELVAQLVEKVLLKKKLKARYLVGKFARITIFMRWLLPDSLMDKLSLVF